MESELLLLYSNLLVHHLDRQEMEHELTIRAVEFQPSESRSAVQRRLKETLKHEKLTKQTNIDWQRCNVGVAEEIKIMDDNIVEILGYLNKTSHFEGLKDSLKTRLAHYFFRARRAQDYAELDADLEDLDKIVSSIRKILNTHFSLFSPVREVHEEVMHQIAESISNLNVSIPAPNQQQHSNRCSPNCGNTGNNNRERVEASDEDSAGEGPSNRFRRELKCTREVSKAKTRRLLLPRSRLAPYQVPPCNQQCPHNNACADISGKEKFIRKFSLESRKDDEVKPHLGTSDSVSNDSSDSSSSSDRPNARVPPRDRRHFRPRYRPVSEWNLHYDGKDGGLGLMKFIKEVEFYARSEKVSKRELFRFAIYLFRGQAKIWFMSAVENDNIANWRDLVRELKREFLSPDHDHVNQIRAISRRQGPKESFHEYLQDMQKLFDSLTRAISEKKKFEMVFRNLRSEYKSYALAAGIDNLVDLKRFGRQLDSTFWFKFTNPSQEGNPPSKRAHVNEMSLSHNTKQTGSRERKKQYGPRNFYASSKSDDYKKPRISLKATRDQPQQSRVAAQGDQESRGLSVLLANYRPPAEGICLNCRLPGHSEAECDKPRHRYCGKCGFHNTDTKNCPYCSKNDQ